MLLGRLTSSRFHVTSLLVWAVVGTLWTSGCRPRQRPAALPSAGTRAAEAPTEAARHDATSAAEPETSTAPAANSPTVAAATQTESAAASADVHDTDDTRDNGDSAEIAGRVGPTDEPSSDSGAPDDATDAAAPAKLDPSAITHRLLVLLSGGPLLLDVQLWVDGRPHEQSVADLTRDVLLAGDADGDGMVSWDELTTSDAFKFGQWGNARVDNEEQRKAIVYRCDINRNRRVDDDELPRFLTFVGGASTWIRAVPPSRVERPLSAAPLFAWLDHDGNQKLDEREMRHAGTRLRMLDREDDGVLAMSELSGAVDSPEMPGMPPNAATQSRGEPARVLMLQADSDWSRLLYAIEDYYAYGSPVQAVDLPSREDLFGAVDANHDGYWSVSEASSLLEQPADLWLTVHYRPDGSTLDVEGASERSPSVHRQSGEQLILPWDQGELVIRTANARSADESTWETIWTQWDASGDGALDADEYARAEPMLNLPMVAVDGNEDGLAQRSETLDAMRRLARAAALRIEFELSTEGESIFRRLDGDGDGRLSERELDVVAEGLLQLAGADGILADDDLTPRQELQIRRGETPAAGAEFRRLPPAAMVEASSGGANMPTWFVESDRNRDGEISRREFLGPGALFEQLDRNGDGRLQPAEVAAAQDAADEPAASETSNSTAPDDRAPAELDDDSAQPPATDAAPQAAPPTAALAPDA